MTAGVTATVSAAIAGAVTKTNAISQVEGDFNEKFTTSILPGTGAGKADIVFSDTRTLAASATENLDLSGVLTDVFGGTIAAAKIKAVGIHAASANTNNVEVGGAASDAAALWFKDVTDIEVIPPGGWSVHVHPGAGWPVTAATADLLKIANSAGTTGVDYDVVIIAASA